MNLFSFVGVVNDAVVFGIVDGGTFELAKQKLEAQLRLRKWEHCRFSLQQLTAPFQMNAVKKAMFDDAPSEAPLG